VKELLEVQQVQCEAKGESSGVGIEGILAECYCMLCVEERRVCRENCESHEMRKMRETCGICEIRETREGHDVKSSKGFEGVVLVKVLRLNMKSLRIERMVRYEKGLPIVLTVHKCSHQDHVGQGIHTEGGSFANTKFIRQEMGSYIP
jgi:hypothetical protein